MKNPPGFREGISAHTPGYVACALRKYENRREHVRGEYAPMPLVRQYDLGMRSTALRLSVSSKQSGCPQTLTTRSARFTTRKVPSMMGNGERSYYVSVSGDLGAELLEMTGAAVRLTRPGLEGHATDAILVVNP